MEVTRYTFQSPYPNQVQVGRPDPTAAKEQSAQKEGSQLLEATNQTQQKAQDFVQTQKSEVTPTLKTSLDIRV